MKKLMVFLSLATCAAFALAGDKKAYLGVYLQNTDDLHENRSDSASPSKGVLISSIVEDSAADKAGLKPDDIIVKINGVEVLTPKEVTRILEDYAPDQKIQVEVLTDGSPKTVQVVLGERPTFKIRHKISPDNKWLSIHEKRPYIGIQMQDLNSQLAAFFNVDGGILVTEVVADSPAEKAGLMAGDILQNWQGTVLKDTGDLYELLAEANENDSIEITVKRHEEFLEIPVTLGAPKERFNFNYSFNFDMKDGENAKELFFDPESLSKHLSEGINDEMKSLRDELRRLKEELKKREREEDR